MVKLKETAHTAAATTALLTIPTEGETLDSFKTGVRAALSSDQTHLYVDTSFLMWMTKLGTQSRAELRAFFDDDCAGRVHVPVWAAHEFLKHHVENTVANNFLKQLTAITNTVNTASSCFRPLLDDPTGPTGEDNAKLRATMNTALRDLNHLVAAGQLWAKAHPARAAEVIDFINAAGARTTQLYEQFPGLGQLGPNRYAGRVPPGFKDGHKGRRDNVDDAASVGSDGSNRFGDLVFWHEILAHAATVKAKCIVIVSNDVKNDWRLRKDATQARVVTPGNGTNSFAIPRAHPMLCLEAKVAAAVNSVLLLDSLSLALILADDPTKRFNHFVKVTYGSADRLPTLVEDRKQRARQAVSAQAVATEDAARKAGFAFADDPSVKATEGTLVNALRSSKNLTLMPEEEELLAQWDAGKGARPVLDALSSGVLGGRNQDWLVRVARELHNRVQDDMPGYEQALFDLVACLPQLPLATASALYLGMLASMYLNRDENTPRLPPDSVVADELFGHQAAPFAPVALRALGRRLMGQKLPLYTPTVNETTLIVKYTMSQNPDVLDELSSMTFRDVELLTLAQSDPKLNLRRIFKANVVDADALRRKACELFAMPKASTRVDGAFEQPFTLPEFLGFKRPNSVYVDNGDDHATRP